MGKFRRSKAVSYEAKCSCQSLTRWGFGVVERRVLTDLERQYLDDDVESDYEKKVRGERK